MNLREFFSIIRRYLGLIIGVSLLASGIAFALSVDRQASYSATTTLRLATVSNSQNGGLSPDLEYTDRLANTYRIVIASQPFHALVGRRLGIFSAFRVDASIPANTELIRVSATASDASQAARIANVSAQMFIARAQRLTATDSAAVKAVLRAKLRLAATQLVRARSRASHPGITAEARAARQSTVVRRETSLLTLQNQYDDATSPTGRPYLSVIERAESPRSANFPSPHVIPVIALALGLLVGVLLALSAARRDTRLRTGVAVASAGDTAILGQVPHMRRSTARNGRAATVLVEPFRRIRTTVLALAELSAPPDSLTLLVTSPGQGEGRTIVAANLATAIARGRHSVLLIDADIARPAVHKVFAIDNAIGLVDVLGGDVTVEEAVQGTTCERLEVLAAGTRPGFDALATGRFKEVLRQLCESFDIVIIDAPPLLGATEAAIIAPLVHGVILVVRSGRTRSEALREAHENLALLRARLLGIVVNDADGEFAMTGVPVTSAVA